MAPLKRCRARMQAQTRIVDPWLYQPSAARGKAYVVVLGSMFWCQKFGKASPHWGLAWKNARWHTQVPRTSWPVFLIEPGRCGWIFDQLARGCAYNRIVWKVRKQTMGSGVSNHKRVNEVAALTRRAKNRPWCCHTIRLPLTRHKIPWRTGSCSHELCCPTGCANDQWASPDAQSPTNIFVHLVY